MNSVIACVLAMTITVAITHPLAGARKKTQQKKKPVIISGDNVRSRFVGVFNNIKRYITELTGRPYLASGTMRLMTRKIIVTDDGKNLVADCIGSVIMTDSKNNSVIRSDRARYLKKEGIVELDGNPQIFTRQKDNSTVIIKAGRIVYRVDDETAEAFARVFVRNKELRIYSDYATYDKKKGEIVFLKNPYIKKNTDRFKADTITYRSGPKVLVLDGRVEITTFADEKDPKTGKMKSVKSITRCDRFENYDDEEKKTIIVGHAIIERESTIFTGDRFVITGKKSDFIEGFNVYIINREEHVDASGGRFQYRGDLKRAMLWNNPYIILRDEKSSRERSRIYGDLIELFRSNDEMVVNGRVRIQQQAEIIYGDLGKYYRKENLFYISGNAYIQRDASLLYSDRIVYNTRTHYTHMVGNIRGKGLRQ